MPNNRLTWREALTADMGAGPMPGHDVGYDGHVEEDKSYLTVAGVTSSPDEFDELDAFDHFYNPRILLEEEENG